MSSTNYNARALALHKKMQGKLGVSSLLPLRNKDDLSLLYTPGVAAVSVAIANDKRLARTLTLKGRTIAVVSDGSAVLGLGNIGPEAALPVMEGKAVLFKTFAGLDAFPIVLASQDTEEIITAVKAIAPTFGGINLEDISAPRCFVVEERLKKELSIPVMHDDQHGTAVVVLAGLLNAAHSVGKKLSELRIVVSGAGAAAMATTKLLVLAGVEAGHIIMFDSQGPLYAARPGLGGMKAHVARLTNSGGYAHDLPGALIGADVFLGMSKANTLDGAWVAEMTDTPIIFALANPDPEISYSEAKKTKARIIGTGRSDFPNQINNVLAFPGIFRGAIDSGATEITDAMKIAAAKAIAGLVSDKDRRKGIVIPKPFDKRVAPAVARAVAREWKKGIVKV